MTISDPTLTALRGFTEAGSLEQRRWEQRFRSLVDPVNLRDTLRVMSAEPHHAGSPACKRLAQRILSDFLAWGLDARIEEFEALLPYPVERVVELVAPHRYVAPLVEPVIEADSTSGNPGQIPTFNAYSANGDVTAPLVYVNYGVPADYERLDALGIDVRGAIVIARYGQTAFRGLKPKTAAERGAVGCLIYSDPMEDGYGHAVPYPEGPGRPAEGVQRGSTYFMPIQNGDPLTVPGTARKRSLEEAANVLPSIPVQPLSHADALPLLRALEGPEAPEDWRGALPLTYRIGPGPATVRLKVVLEWTSRPIYDVIATIEGAECPDQWIIRGNHHDAWVHGAADPGSGSVTLLETARVLGQLLREGWRPRRTIVLASWDAEEWGLIGSSEWGMRHGAELRDKAVAYLNTDLTGRAWLNPGGSHSLQALVSEAADEVPQPFDHGSVFAAARARLVEVAPDPAARAALSEASALPLYGLGAETDYAVFINHLGIASLDLWFDGGWSWRGVYHSSYDSFDWYRRFGDPTFEYGRALTETTGLVLLRLASAAVVPFEFTGLARAVRGYADEIETLRRADPKAPALDWTPVATGLARLGSAGEAWEQALRLLGELPAAAVTRSSQALESIDRLIYRTERLLCLDSGLPDRPWFRHLVSASDPYRGRIVSTLPPIREGVERQQWEQAMTYLPILGEALTRVAEQVDGAARRLAQLR